MDQYTDIELVKMMRDLQVDIAKRQQALAAVMAELEKRVQDLETKNQDNEQGTEKQGA